MSSICDTISKKEVGLPPGVGQEAASSFENGFNISNNDQLQTDHSQTLAAVKSHTQNKPISQKIV